MKNNDNVVVFGAVEKTRTSTGCPTATSTLRVYQFRHDRIVVGPDCSGAAACSKSIRGAQERCVSFFKFLHSSPDRGSGIVEQVP